LKDTARIEVSAERDCSKIKNHHLEGSSLLQRGVQVGVPWYEGKFYVVALRDHTNLGFSVKRLSKQEMTLFEGKGKMMRHVKFYSTDDIDETKVVKLLQLVAEKREGC
jgi:hypothetical protein